MKLPLLIAASALLSGCVSQETHISGTQWFGYPALGTGRMASTLGPVRPATLLPKPQAFPAVAAAMNPPPYDMAKDSYVTAVLLPPVESDLSLQYEPTADGKRRPLPPSPRLEVISIADAASVYDAANP